MISSHGGRGRRRRVTAATAILAVVLLGACGNGGGKSSASTTTIGVRTNQRPIPPVAKSLARRWCALRLGSTPAAVKKAMGKPHGTDAHKHKEILPRGTVSLEWDTDPFVFVASFKKNRATTLQAYNRSVGPIIGAYGLPCKAFRQR